MMRKACILHLILRMVCNFPKLGMGLSEKPHTTRLQESNVMVVLICSSAFWKVSSFCVHQMLMHNQMHQGNLALVCPELFIQHMIQVTLHMLNMLQTDVTYVAYIIYAHNPNTREGRSAPPLSVRYLKSHRKHIRS
jgi:hypothetical protein